MTADVRGLDRPLDRCRQYEEALLAAILTGHADLPAVERIVDETDFESPLLGEIWTACVEAHRTGHDPVPLIVKDHLTKEPGKPPRVDPLFLIELKQRDEIPAQATYYADRVHELAVLRRLGDLGVSMQQTARTAADTVVGEAVTIADRYRSQFEDLTRSRGGTVTDAWKALQMAIDATEGDVPQSIPTAWPALTDLLGGWYPGQMITIGGRPGQGKSIALENLCTDVSRIPGCHGLYVSLEMSATELMQRTIAYTANVDLTTIRRGKNALSEAERQRIDAAVPIIAKQNLEIVDDAYTFEEIRAAAWGAHQRAIRAGGYLRFVAIDYVQLIQTRIERGVNRTVLLGEISRGVKRLAKELHTTVAIGGQLNREVEHRTGNRPQLSDLRETGDFENDSDVVILIHPDKVEYNGKLQTGDTVDLIVAKHRNGPLGTVTLGMYGHYARFWDRPERP